VEETTILNEGPEATTGFPPADYRVELEDFSGTLELLLASVREHALDPAAIPLAAIVRQFLNDLRVAGEVNLTQAGEVLWITATLARIKVRALLPELPADLDAEMGDEGEDPREALERKLEDYRRYRAVASTLASHEDYRRLHFERGAEEASLSRRQAPLEIDLARLLSTFRKVLREAEAEALWDIEAEAVSFEEMLAQLETRLREERELPFRGLFRRGASRFEIIVVFIALLELIRSRKVGIRTDRDAEPVLTHLGEG
jgi:segregation and condensation protein A